MYGVLVEDEFGLSRDELAAELLERGIESRTFFCPMNLQPFLRDQPGFRNVPCPVAEDLWRRGLYLPLVPVAHGRGDRAHRGTARRARSSPLVNSYTGLHARVYDEIYADKPYAAEARFVHELAGSRGGKLLDVACGTGRHALAFAELGYDVTGTDINEQLLAVARDAAGDRVRFVQGDMCELDVEGAPFDVVTCLFDSIGYPQDDDRVISALRSLGRHGAPRAAIVCEFLHAPAIVRGAEPVRVKRLVLQDGRTLTRTSETAIDVERMLMHVRYDLLVLDGYGSAEHAQEEQANRLFSAPEMRLLASEAELDVRAIVPAYVEGPIDADTFHLLLVAEAGP